MNTRAKVEISFIIIVIIIKFVPFLLTQSKQTYVDSSGNLFGTLPWYLRHIQENIG